MNEEDIKKQLEVKNKEIYLNKLNLDLDNNLEVLVLTIDNLLKIQSEELQKKIIEIAESFQDEKVFKQKITEFMNSYNDYLMNLFEQKKIKLKENLEIDTDILKNQKKVQELYDKTSLTIEDDTSKLIDNLANNLQEYFDTDFKIQRLNTYLSNIFLKNLNNKVLAIIRNRDIILINTYKETYLKYLELNKNTVGI